MRPKVSEQTAERLKATVDDLARIPAHHLTFSQQLEFLLDEAEEQGIRGDGPQEVKSSEIPEMLKSGGAEIRGNESRH